MVRVDSPASLPVRTGPPGASPVGTTPARALGRSGVQGTGVVQSRRFREQGWRAGPELYHGGYAAMRKQVRAYKPPPPPKPRYKARQEPLVVYVTFLLCREERLVRCCAAVLVADFLVTRTWAQRAFSAGLVVCRDGWVQYVAPHAVLAVEHMDTDLPYREQIAPEDGALQPEDLSMALIGASIDVWWADPAHPEVVVQRDAALEARAIAAYYGDPAPVQPQRAPKRRARAEDRP
jgi:hypothetical protein